MLGVFSLCDIPLFIPGYRHTDSLILICLNSPLELYLGTPVLCFDSGSEAQTFFSTSGYVYLASDRIPPGPILGSNFKLRLTRVQFSAVLIDDWTPLDSIGLRGRHSE
jgi:hypothetical protein